MLGAFNAEDILAPAALVAAEDHARVLIYEASEDGLVVLASAPPRAASDEPTLAWHQRALADGRLNERSVTVGGRELVLAVDQTWAEEATTCRAPNSKATTLCQHIGFSLATANSPHALANGARSGYSSGNRPASWNRSR